MVSTFYNFLLLGKLWFCWGCYKWQSVSYLIIWVNDMIIISGARNFDLQKCLKPDFINIWGLSSEFTWLWILLNWILTKFLLLLYVRQTKKTQLILTISPHEGLSSFDLKDSCYTYSWTNNLMKVGLTFVRDFCDCYNMPSLMIIVRCSQIVTEFCCGFRSELMLRSLIERIR